MKKNLLIIILIGIIVIGLTGCGENTNQKQPTNDTQNNNSNKVTEKGEEEEVVTSKEATGEYVYMFNKTQRMKIGSEPSKYGDFYESAEEAMKIYGYDMTIRHKLENGKIVSSDVGFKYNGKIYYINGQDSSLYESNKKKLKDIFGVENCSDGKTYYQCKNDTISVNVWQAGGAETNVDREYCHSGDDFAKCGTH